MLQVVPGSKGKQVSKSKVEKWKQWNKKENNKHGKENQMKIHSGLLSADKKEVQTYETLGSQKVFYDQNFMDYRSTFIGWKD